MNLQFNKFKPDAILHLKKCKVARCFHAVLIIRTGHLGYTYAALGLTSFCITFPFSTSIRRKS
jgi:hypothetical protein